MQNSETRAINVQSENSAIVPTAAIASCPIEGVAPEDQPGSRREAVQRDKARPIRVEGENRTPVALNVSTRRPIESAAR